MIKNIFSNIFTIIILIIIIVPWILYFVYVQTNKPKSVTVDQEGKYVRSDNKTDVVGLGEAVKKAKGILGNF
jgi:hypothetical protein